MKKHKKKFNNIKKSLKGFIVDEEGFVSKENILKIGLGTISALGIIGSLSNAFAAHSNTLHNNIPGEDTVTRSGSLFSHTNTPHTNIPSHSEQIDIY